MNRELMKGSKHRRDMFTLTSMFMLQDELQHTELTADVRGLPVLHQHTELQQVSWGLINVSQSC